MCSQLTDIKVAPPKQIAMIIKLSAKYINSMLRSNLYFRTAFIYVSSPAAISLLNVLDKPRPHKFNVVCNVAKKDTKPYEVSPNICIYAGINIYIEIRLHSLVDILEMVLIPSFFILTSLCSFLTFFAIIKHITIYIFIETLFQIKNIKNNL